MSDIVNKLWGFCHTLRHDGIGYLDYIEQLTFLLFIKMADERGIDLSRMKLRSDLQPVTNDSATARGLVDCSWPALSRAAGTGLIDHYVDVIRTLGKQPGILGDIFSGGQSRFRSPVNLKKLISLIDETEWTTLGVDVKAQAFEGLLEKAADEGKKGAGQYFTPRLLIESLVRCVKPDPRKHKEFTICDPGCGTGGFLMCAYEWLVKQTKDGALDRDLAKRVREQTYFGQDIDPAPRRLALMNLYLHNLTPHIKLGDSIYEDPDSRRFDVVMTNPPFGTRGANQAPTRDDFTIATSNKQLNFVQHIMTILKPGGRAVVVLPDNCLFADQAGEVFKVLTEDCDLHTVLRLPNGTFSPYSPGTKTNVVFFTKGFPTENTWIYDCRTNVPHITKTERPLTEGQFAEFEKCFGDDPNGRAKRKEKDSKEDRWHCFGIEQVKERGYKLDGLKWLKDDSLEDASDLPEPDELATDAIEELTAAVKGLNAIIKSLENS
ncbi:MAG TPA: class I SAM-dependent DNA methyltransferase [bacterium]|nr:class I SAM-dependent DNA methyltransferase [bacterium]